MDTPCGQRFLGRIGVAAFLAVLAASAARADFPYEQAPINYLTAPTDDPVARLQKKIDKGALKLAHDEEGQGYLKAVLNALKVPTESQTLVFTKTSFQQSRIAPKTPRALYFADDVYVGYVRGGDVLEFSTADPHLGAVFYVLDQQRADRPEFVRQTHACLICHSSGKTRDVPGHFVRSVYPARSGLPVFNAGSFVTDVTSPLSERWGGWYVTGTHGRQRHMGNVLVTDNQHPSRLETDRGANRTNLNGLVDTYPYLTGDSDIVALMVLEHQTQTHNALTLANYQARTGRHYDAGINKALDQPAGTVSESTERRIVSAGESLVQALLFCGEIKLIDPVAGTSGFTGRFASAGPRDPLGRSLRDFDLRTRLFKYPCSYLIYSEAFDTLPSPMKSCVYRRLLEVLTGSDKSPEFVHLSPADRRAILEILNATKTDLPDDWKEAARR